MTTAKLAEAVQVDAKTVERWIVAGRVPYRKHRYTVAAFFGVDESYIWPDALDQDQVAAASESEIVAVYPYRWAVPRDAWGHLFGHAEQEIGMLVYSCISSPKTRRPPRVRRRAERCAGPDPARRSGQPACGRARTSEGIDEAMPAKVRSAIAMFRPLQAVENVEIRLHGTILYNSIFRGDDQLFVNTHIYGTMANNAPFFHLRKIAGGAMASTTWRALSASGTERHRTREREPGRRIDYYDDPRRRRPTALSPPSTSSWSTMLARSCMIRRSDNDNWAVPGGAIDLGESVAQAAVRETHEESGIECEITGIVGIYTDPKHVILYTSNGLDFRSFTLSRSALG